MADADTVRRTLEPILPRLEALRGALHRCPSLSGQEEPTAERLREWLSANAPARFVGGLGGAGLAAVFEGEQPGPTVLLRAELDALPIREPGEIAQRSEVEGVSHKCGHDGHMTVLAGVGALLAQAPPARGRVVLLFQPAEETGTGARAVVADPKFADIAPDYAFALHNLPGYPAGCVALRAGPFAAASEGLKVCATGVSSHASEPHLGRNPALALSQMVPSLLALPAQLLPMDAVASVVITHLKLGEPSFGTSPGEGRLQATFRAASGDDLERLLAAAEQRAEHAGAACGLEVRCSRHDAFGETINDAAAVRLLERVAERCRLEIVELERPFPWSEDFGEILGRCRGAMFGLGSGRSCPPLHSEGYDFPDAILEAGVLAMFSAVSAALTEGLP